jgi:hypothetical protein
MINPQSVSKNIDLPPPYKDASWVSKHSSVLLLILNVSTFVALLSITLINKNQKGDQGAQGQAGPAGGQGVQGQTGQTGVQGSPGVSQFLNPKNITIFNVNTQTSVTGFRDNTTIDVGTMSFYNSFPCYNGVVKIVNSILEISVCRDYPNNTYIQTTITGSQYLYELYTMNCVSCSNTACTGCVLTRALFDQSVYRCSLNLPGSCVLSGSSITILKLNGCSSWGFQISFDGGVLSGCLISGICNATCPFMQFVCAHGTLMSFNYLVS